MLVIRYFTFFTWLVFCGGLACAQRPAAEAPQPAQLTPVELAEGWVQLFDGQSLFGWKQVGGGDWRVEGGEIRVDKGEPGWLMTSVDWADYELHVEFKASATTNSGVFLRSTEQPTDPTKDCVEINIAPADNPFPTTSQVGRLKTDWSAGGKRRKSNGQSGDDEQPLGNPWDGQWHTLVIKVRQLQCEVSLDGVTPNVYFSEEQNYGRLAEGTVRRGRIGLQFNSGAVAFRNVRLKPLATKPIFNGRDLSDWNLEHKQAGQFSVTPAGELQLTSGRGQIESDASYGDFVLHLECFVNGDALNSGVFFRSIPREFTNGYESQIHNAVVDGDPTKPVDCGTGGIYRRVNARRVNAQDRQWFAKTIVATGNRIAVWVDGYQVTDWTDTRPPHDNPRTGRRTAPGTLSLQAHDPTTDVRFRNLRIAELPAK